MARTQVRQTQVDPTLATDQEVQDDITARLGPTLGSMATLPVFTTGLVKLSNGEASLDEGIYQPVVAGSGVVIQTLRSLVVPQSGNAQVALNNTLPTISSGTQIWSGYITPTRTTSKIRVTGSFVFDSSSGTREAIVMVFRGTTCIGVTLMYIHAVARPITITIDFQDTPNTTSATTYTVRIGMNASGTWYVGQASSAYFAGMLAKGGITLQELA